MLATVCKSHRHTVGRVQGLTAARKNEWVPTMSERVGILVVVEAMSSVFSEGSGTGGGREGRSTGEGHRSYTEH